MINYFAERWADYLTLVVVLAACMGAYVLIGDLYDRFFITPAAEKAHREAIEGAQPRRPWDDENDPFNG